MTIISDVNVTGLPEYIRLAAEVSPEQFTTRFQGDHARIEMPDGSILLFDSGRHELYALEPATRTYRVGSTRDFEDFLALFPTDQADRISVNTVSSFGRPTGSATYAGASASRIEITGEARISGRFGSFDDYPGFSSRFYGDFSSHPTPYDRGESLPGGGMQSGFNVLRYPVYGVSGNYWASPDVILGQERHPLVLPLVLQMMWGGAPFVGSLIQQIDKSRDLPLHSAITVTHTYPPNYFGDYTNTPPDETITTTFDVKSILEQPLDSRLFEIPAGYTRDNRALALPQITAPRIFKD